MINFDLSISFLHFNILVLLFISKIMDKGVGTLLHFWGVFQFTQAQALPSPHKQCWTRVSTFFSEFQLYIWWGEEELQKKVRKDALFYEGTQK